jgi:hypothetical protein
MVPQIQSTGGVYKKLVNSLLDVSLIRRAIVTLNITGKHGRRVNQEPIAL